MPLLLEGKEIGTVLRTHTGTNPLYISPGHKMDTDTAVRFVMRCRGRYRVPDPTRRAHLLVTEMRTQHLS